MVEPKIQIVWLAVDKTEAVSMRGLLEMIESEDTEIKIVAIEKLIGIVREISSAIVTAMENGPNRFLIAERLVGIGTVCAGDLKDVLNKSKSSEARELAALVLEKLGSYDDPSFLMRMIQDDSEYYAIAVRALTRRNEDGLIPLLVQKLDSIDISNIDMIISYLAALKELNARPSRAFIARALDEHAQWYLRKIVEEDFR